MKNIKNILKVFYNQLKTKKMDVKKNYLEDKMKAYQQKHMQTMNELNKLNTLAMQYEGAILSIREMIKELEEPVKK